MRTQTKETQHSLTPDRAIAILKEGNRRFVNNIKVNRNLLQQVNETSEGQYPFAVILSCIDSRTSAELIFDQGLGDVFSIRIAGNVINDDILGSMEFACKVAGSKLILVLGHTKCGAIKGACDGVALGNLTGLLKKIKPAIEVIQSGKLSLVQETEYVEQVAHANVLVALAEVRKRSPILNELIDTKAIALVGGMYNLTTGEVEFYEEKEIVTDLENILQRLS